MSNQTIWAVLSDGRYIRVMVNNGEDAKLNVLDADKNEELAALCYKMVNSKPEFSVSGSVKAEEINFLQLQAEFLVKQYQQDLFDKLILAAPNDVIQSIRSALPSEMNQLVIGELAEDLTAKSNDIIQAKLADIISDN